MPLTADADVLAREQAAEATALWAVGEFDAAHQTLQRLDASLPSDARVQLNLWVAGYYADASSSLDSVAKDLETWLKSHTADAADPTQQTGHAVAALNYALILFLQQQHAAALSVLEPLFEDVDVLQDGAALCVCVLLLEIYLDSLQLPRAVQLLEYLQGLPAAAAASAGAVQPSVAEKSPAGPAGSSRSNSSSHDSSQQQQQQEAGKDAAAGGAGGAAQPSGTQQEARPDQQQSSCQDSLLSSQPLSQALPVVSKTKSEFMQEVWLLVQQQGGKPPGHNLGPLLHLYKARLALACHNYKAAKKEVRGLLSCDPDSHAAVLLKAQAEAMRQQPKKALKTLAPVLTAAPQATIRCRLQLLNLLAAVHHQLDKHHVAALYLSTALSQHQEAQQQQYQQPASSDSDQQQQKTQQGGNRQQQQQQKKKQAQAKPAGDVADPAASAPASGKDASLSRCNHWLLQDMSDALSYNLGLEQLALQDWQGALECFEAASAKYFTLPQLWLRWAEACVGLFHQQQQQQQQQQLDAQQQQDTSAPAQGASGKGDVGAAKGEGKGKEAGGKKQQQQSSSPEHLLEQAAAHLSTGLVLLQEQQAAAAKQLEAATAAAAAAVAAGEPMPELWQPPSSMGSAAAPAAAREGKGDALGMGASSSGTALAEASSSSTGGAGASASTAGPSTPQAAAGATGPGTPVLSSWPAEAALLAPELAAVKQALLANQAYVHLLLNQPEHALAAALDLVACSSMSPQQHYLGSSYAAEALCLLGRADEAKQQLQGHMELFNQYSSSSGGSATLSTGAAGADQPNLYAAGTAEPRSSGAAEPTGAAAAAAVAGSIKSHDSCISCARGVCGGASGVNLARQTRAAALQNMSALLLLQGDYQQAQRHAAMAAAVMEGL